eukprot:TRINITY_DN10012_c0_g1_i2.p2 TRINITY_DN10012_c0_g1~~TRINITY_DN10012_c0_g1_i2.p2  ORF type:complete len:171 (-),score=13.66 TRINITY_DN10012_c0_g1_i2:14-526(-)
MYRVVILQQSWVFFFFSSRRRHTRSCLVSWARRCVQETGLQQFQRLMQVMVSIYFQLKIAEMIQLKARWICFQHSLLIMTQSMLMKKIRNYYEIGDFKTDEEMKQADEVVKNEDVEKPVVGKVKRSRAVGKDKDDKDCLLYTSDAADDMQCVDLGGRCTIQNRTKYNVKQ